MGYCQTMLKNLHISFLLRFSLLIILTILFYIAISFSGKVQIKAQEFNLYSLNVGIGESSPPDFIPPSVWITSPSDGALVSGTVSYDVTAFDNVGVTRIEFYADNTLVGTDTSAPYSTLWDTTSFSNNLHTLFASAFDAAGNVGTSYSVTVRVDNTGPSVAILNPPDGSSVSGVINVQASATDDVAVSSVSFYVDGGLLGTDTSAPYFNTWDTTSYSNALHTLFAKAFDLAGNIGTSYSITVTVDNLAPSVSLTNPTAGSTVSGNVNLTSNASDNNSVTRVEYYVDSNFIGIGATSANFPYNWNSAAVADGNHNINAKAFDIVNNTTTSQTVSVTVDNNAPTVSITSPANGSNVSGIVDVTANASDAVGVTSVEFYADGGLIATDTSAPYSTNWDTTVYAHNTSHSLTAKAYDGAGHITTSSVVSVTVLDITAPSVNITNPLNGAIVPRNTIVTITANSSDVSGIQKVEFRVNNVLKCTDTTAPYSCNWNVPPQKNKPYAIQAKAFDNVPLTATHTINVTSSN